MLEDGSKHAAGGPFPKAHSFDFACLPNPLKICKTLTIHIKAGNNVNCLMAIALIQQSHITDIFTKTV